MWLILVNIKERALILEVLCRIKKRWSFSVTNEWISPLLIKKLHFAFSSLHLWKFYWQKIFVACKSYILPGFKCWFYHMDEWKQCWKFCSFCDLNVFWTMWNYSWYFDDFNNALVRLPSSTLMISTMYYSWYFDDINKRQVWLGKKFGHLTSREILIGSFNYLFQSYNEISF